MTMPAPTPTPADRYEDVVRQVTSLVAQLESTVGQITQLLRSLAVSPEGPLHAGAAPSPDRTAADGSP